MMQSKTKAQIRDDINLFFLSPEGKALKHKAIKLQNEPSYCRAFLNRIQAYEEAKTIFAYYPLKQEFPTEGLLNTAYNDGKTIALPVVCGEYLTFKRVYIRKGKIEPVKRGSFGVLEPMDAAETLFYTAKNKEAIVKIEFPLAVLLPGRAFTLKGERLGWGGGFYDRFLESLLLHAGKEKISLAGLCFSRQVMETLPVEDFDHPVDIVLTENL